MSDMRRDDQLNDKSVQRKVVYLHKFERKFDQKNRWYTHDDWAIKCNYQQQSKVA